MGIKYLCADCGWSEFAHLYRKTDISDSELAKRNGVLPDYFCNLMECSGYLPPEAEKEEIRQLQAQVAVL